MAKSLLNVRTQLRAFLDEVTPLDWTNSELNVLINTYYHAVRTTAINIFEDYYMTTTTFNSIANQEEYGSTNGAPTDVYKMRRVELNFDVTATAGAPTRCLPVFNIDAVRRDLGYSNAGIGLKIFGNAFYYTYGFGSNFKIGFIPMPSNPGGSGTNAIKIWYIKEAADLVNDSDTLDIPYADRYWINVTYGATADALRFGQQAVSEAEDFDKKFELMTERMEEELEERISEEGKSVIDTSGDYIDFNSPY